MKCKVEYVLHVGFDALSSAFKKVFGHTNWHRCHWIDSGEGLYDDDENHAIISFIQGEEDDLVFSDFIKLMCYSLPISKHNMTGFYVSNNIIANKNNSVCIQNGAVIDHNHKDVFKEYNTFNVDEKAFNENAYEKLRRIELICNEGQADY